MTSPVPVVFVEVSVLEAAASINDFSALKLLAVAPPAVKSHPAAGLASTHRRSGTSARPMASQIA